MDLDKIRDAKAEALRFLAAVKVVEEIAKDEASWKYIELIGSKETGSLRRASLDLTRTLANMRKRG